LRAVMEAMPAMVAVAGIDHRYRLVNRAFERWRGMGRNALVGQSIEETIGADEYQERLPYIRQALAGETAVEERQYPEGEGLRFMAVIYVPLHTEDNAAAGFIEIAQDITHHRQEHSRLRHISEHDPLTGLLNRAGFHAYLRQKYLQGEAATLAVLYVDLDYFKSINDRYGHATGDELLRHFSERLQALVRPTDAVARLGGDEFAIGLPGVLEFAHAVAIAEKVVRGAAEPFQIGPRMLQTSVSVGVAHRADEEGGWEGLIERADRLLYQAKGAGRGQVAIIEDQANPDSAIPAA
jgi:diguanylate cyclase (GGDEF)-like protein/PAS domain S-box-containing protein